MERFSNAIFLFAFALSAALGKDLHVKEYNVQKNSDDQGFNFNIYDNYNTSHNKRYVRHLQVQAVTETVISHLFNKIKNRYPSAGNDTTLRKLLKNLRSRLKLYVHKRKQLKKKITNTTENLNYV